MTEFFESDTELITETVCESLGFMRKMTTIEGLLALDAYYDKLDEENKARILDDFDIYMSLSATRHKGVCSCCGKIVFGMHMYDVNADTCIYCGY